MATADLLAGLLSSRRLTSTRLSDGTGVVLDTSTLQLLAVNRTGQVLVEALESGAATTAELVARLVAEFEVDEASAAADVAAFLEALRALLPDAG